MRSNRAAVLAGLISGLAAALAVGGLFLLAGAFEEEEDGPSTGPASAATLFERSRSGVVQVEARPPGTPLSFGRPSREDGIATGTGFVIDDAGHIVTNDHVAAGGRVVTVQTAPRTRRVRARIVGRDRSTDLALLRVDPREAPQLAALPLGRSENVRVGDTAIAIGSRSGCSARSPPASCPPPDAPSTPPTASRSTAPCRPTPRSTRATRVARCSTRRAG